MKLPFKPRFVRNNLERCFYSGWSLKCSAEDFMSLNNAGECALQHLRTKLAGNRDHRQDLRWCRERPEESLLGRQAETFKFVWRHLVFSPGYPGPPRFFARLQTDFAS